jgi:hypothetical protein
MPLYRNLIYKIGSIDENHVSCKAMIQGGGADTSDGCKVKRCSVPGSASIALAPERARYPCSQEDSRNIRKGADAYNIRSPVTLCCDTGS